VAESGQMIFALFAPLEIISRFGTPGICTTLIMLQ